MKHFAAAAFAAFITTAVGFASASGAGSQGQWSIAPMVPPDPARVQLHIAYGRASWDNAVALADAGIDADRLNGPAGPVTFEIRREPGAFTLTGTAGAGSGSGELTYAPNASFDDALASHGFGRPTVSQSAALAVGGTTLAFLDRLHPSIPHASVDDVVRLLDHGVTPRYLAAYDALGYHLDSAPEVQRLIDTGATPGFIRALQRAGVQSISPQQAVRLASTGVSAGFVERLKSRGYTNLSVDELIRLRNSGAPL
ncbi:MAG: hypothetical protein M3169_03230 [Candidatus Eremiobacteraeota bacterium]|nr:hypothetical protein [Candidatus Eremiobacteraeota bacterium]